jgi:poly-gamma-glutamate synthesis protein (capsule biosynthesis protein)
MTGRGIDQVLPHPSDPRIYEDEITSALTYIALAEETNGQIPRPVKFSYVWGDVLAKLDEVRPDARIINLETSITQCDDYERKGINYRMSPENTPCLTAAGIDCCVLANNHVLDWGRRGLEETVAMLAANKLKSTGAGQNSENAAAPAVIDIGEKGRVIIFGFGSVTSGIPRRWRATADRSGVNLLADYSGETVDEIAMRIRAVGRPGDIIVASIHWGANWGYDISDDERRFAHSLINHAGVDVVHGHSTHHAKGIEVYQDRLILYGCGDFLNDYEGIRGYERFRDDLSLMYFATLQVSTGRLVRLAMVPLQIKKFRLSNASREDAGWLSTTLNRESAKLGAAVELGDDSQLRLTWM